MLVVMISLRIMPTENVLSPAFELTDDNNIHFYFDMNDFVCFFPNTVHKYTCKPSLMYSTLSAADTHVSSIFEVQVIAGSRFASQPNDRDWSDLVPRNVTRTDHRQGIFAKT